MSESQNLEKAIKDYIHSLIAKAVTEEEEEHNKTQEIISPTPQEKTETLKILPSKNVTVTPLKSSPTAPQRVNALKTDTVVNLKLKDHLTKALTISKDIDTDTDSRVEIYNKLVKLEDELESAQKSFEGGD